MTSPLDRDLVPDQLLPYAPKWVRDAAHTERRGTAPKSQETVEDDDAQQSIAALSAPHGGLVIDSYRLPRSLEPTVMPELCPVPPLRSDIRVLARYAIAAAVVVVLAVLVAGKFPIPWTVSAKDPKEDAPSFGSRFSAQNLRAAEQRKLPVPQLNLRQEDPRASGEAFPLGASVAGAAVGASVVVEGLADGSTVTAGQSLGANTWRIPISDLRNTLVQPPPDYAGAMNIVLELRLADDTPVDRKPLRLEWAAAASPKVTQFPTDLKPTFDQLVRSYTTASTDKSTLSAREREILFKKFQQFLDSEKRTRSARARPNP
jgi:hypothetical protein